MGQEGRLGEMGVLEGFGQEAFEGDFAGAMPVFLVLLNHAVGDPVAGAHGLELLFKFGAGSAGGLSPMNTGFRDCGLALGGIGGNGGGGGSRIHDGFLLGGAFGSCC